MNLKLLNKPLKKFCETPLQSSSSTLRMRPPMKHPPNPQKGYSLIELLVVLAIVAILAIAGISMLGNRPGGAVRGVMDELEGSLLEAHKLAVATGRDVLIVTKGDWLGAGSPLIMTRGVVTPTSTPATILTAGQLASESFRVGLSGTVVSREHMHAGVPIPGSTWWATAQGTNQALDAVEPFVSEPFKTAGITSPNYLFQGATVNSVRISGGDKRFTSTFVIRVVGLSNGNAIPSGPMGLILVQANGATIYKFYNPGARDGDGKWRRI